MFTAKEIRDKLKDKNLIKVAENTGLSYNTVLYFFHNWDKEPTYRTVKALSDYLECEHVRKEKEKQ